MKTQDIKNIASAYKQVQEKAKMDPVNPDELKGTHAQRKDKDINNDGKVDDTDEYLHARRKAIKTAMKKEEVELDEISKSTLSSYVKKAKKSNPVTQARKDYFSAHGKLVKSTKDNQDELLGNLDQKKKDFDKAVADRKSRLKYVKLAKKKLAKEEFELDEVSDKKLDAYRQKAFADQPSGDDGSDKYRKRKFGRDLAFAKQTGRAKVLATKESVEQLDELSPKTLKSYVKKATGDAITKAYKAGDVRDKDSGKNYMKALGRQLGISKATSKLAKEEVELDEAAPKIKPDFMKTQREKDRAHDAAMGRTATGRKKVMTSTQRSMASMRKEDTDMSMKEKLQLQKESILEREMTDAEMKKREDIVKGMKKNKADLEKRYGSRWKDVMYATATKQAMESVDNALEMTKNLLTTKESFKTETTNWPVYARIKENRALQTKGATAPEAIDSKASGMEKDFVAKHGGLNGTDSGIDGAKAAEYTAKNATTGIKPGAGMNRTGDQKIGDKNIIKSTEAK
jgi:hypothetical protein